ncbi:MAG TPA: anhydro-N-acetylmuramic acid kinase [Halothiobacillus sp.]|nr:anhydro-N-acetylmuramic acid kinase [Halothiobacillus sp.]
MNPQLYIGLMSGTSMDAVDGCLVDFAQSPPKLVANHSLPMDALRDSLRALATGCYPDNTDPIELLGEVDQQLARLFAQCAQALITQAGVLPTDIRAIGSHGQTIRHRPGARLPFTLQIGDPNYIAEACGIPVVADFRRRDVAAGGQGAPLVPPAHHALFGTTGQALLVINLGGIANITQITATGAVSGFDTGPANTLMDSWIKQHLGNAYDQDGHWAASGKPNTLLLTALLEDPWFRYPPPKSTGPEYFNLRWLKAQAQRYGIDIELLAPEDVQATLLELTTASVIDAAEAFIRAHTPQIVVAGGGAKNPALLASLARRVESLGVQAKIKTSMEMGVDPQWVECMAFAWLARETIEGRANNAPAVTGARRSVVLGGIYPA